MGFYCKFSLKPIHWMIPKGWSFQCGSTIKDGPSHQKCGDLQQWAAGVTSTVQPSNLFSATTPIYLMKIKQSAKNECLNHGYYGFKSWVYSKFQTMLKTSWWHFSNRIDILWVSVSTFSSKPHWRSNVGAPTFCRELTKAWGVVPGMEAICGPVWVCHFHDHFGSESMGDTGIHWK